MAMIFARDTISGKIAEIDERFLTLAPFSDHLVIAKGGEKDYAAQLYTPKNADEFTEAHPAKEVDGATDSKKEKP